MGLFDFAKEIGNKLFSDDQEAAQKIADHIEANNPGISQLIVTFKDGQVTIFGETDTTAAAQKVILMAGNVKGVTDVVANIQISEFDSNQSEDVVQALESDDVEYYIIKSGDSLSKIAKHYYQNAMEYPRIFEANKEVIKDPDLIYPGQKIRIPLA